MTIPSRLPNFLVGLALGIAVLFAWSAPHALANETVVVHMGQKFLRGTANVTTGVGELPKQIYLQSKHHPLTGPLLGLFDGIAMTVVRISAGVCEVGTFLFPLPHHYEPLLEPAFVWEREKR